MQKSLDHKHWRLGFTLDTGSFNSSPVVFFRCSFSTIISTVLQYKYVLRPTSSHLLICLLNLLFDHFPLTCPFTWPEITIILLCFELMDLENIIFIDCGTRNSQWKSPCRVSMDDQDLLGYYDQDWVVCLGGTQTGHNDVKSVVKQQRLMCQQHFMCKCSLDWTCTTSPSVARLSCIGHHQQMQCFQRQKASRFVIGPHYLLTSKAIENATTQHNNPTYILYSKHVQSVCLMLHISP